MKYLLFALLLSPLLLAQKINLATQVRGVLPKANGGTSTTTGASTIASGTATLGTSSIGSGACATVVTVTATGVLTTDVLTAGFNGDPTAVTGYVPLTSGILTIYVYPGTNTANFKVCNLSSSSITPGALTLNWRVAR